MYKVVPNTVGMPQQSRMTRCSGPLSQDLVDKKMGLIVPLKGGSEVTIQYQSLMHVTMFTMHVILLIPGVPVHVIVLIFLGDPHTASTSWCCQRGNLEDKLEDY